MQRTVSIEQPHVSFWREGESVWKPWLEKLKLTFPFFTQTIRDGESRCPSPDDNKVIFLVNLILALDERAAGMSRAGDGEANQRRGNQDAGEESAECHHLGAGGSHFVKNQSLWGAYCVRKNRWIENRRTDLLLLNYKGRRAMSALSL